MIMKVLSLYITNKNLLTVQSLWHVNYQILLIISQKELIKLKLINVNIAVVFFNMKVSRTV